MEFAFFVFDEEAGVGGDSADDAGELSAAALGAAMLSVRVGAGARGRGGVAKRGGGAATGRLVVRLDGAEVDILVRGVLAVHPVQIHFFQGSLSFGVFREAQ